MSTKTLPTPEETLKAAADYIREHGWVKGHMGGGGGPACALGGIREAVDAALPNPHVFFSIDAKRETLSRKARELLMARIKSCFPRSKGAREDNVPDFNDVKTRTVEQVLRVLDGDCQ